MVECLKRTITHSTITQSTLKLTQKWRRTSSNEGLKVEEATHNGQIALLHCIGGNVHTNIYSHCEEALLSQLMTYKILKPVQHLLLEQRKQQISATLCQFTLFFDI